METLHGIEVEILAITKSFAGLPAVAESHDVDLIFSKKAACALELKLDLGGVGQ